MLGHCPDNLDDYVYFSQLSLYCAIQEYNLIAQASFYLYCCCEYIATYTNMEQKLQRLHVFKGHQCFRQFPKKNFEAIFQLFGTYKKLVMYWQSFLFKRLKVMFW